MTPLRDLAGRFVAAFFLVALRAVFLTVGMMR
jgi:hypothetical protein